MHFFLQDETSTLVDKIIKSLNKLMDGDISDQMKQKGLHYKTNYGASVLWLRQLANKYKGNNELANRLWHREIRETMILATLIANPDENFTSIITQWIEAIPSNEIAEQLGANLLWKLSNSYDLATQLISSNNPNKQAIGWVTLAIYVQKQNIIIKEELDKLLILVSKTNDNEGLFIMRVKGRFLRQLCRQSDKHIKPIEEIITHLKHSKKAKWLIEDITTEIDYLKELQRLK